MTADNVIRKILLIMRATNWTYRDNRGPARLKITALCLDYLGLTEDLDCELLCEDIEKMIINKKWMHDYIGWQQDLNKSPIE